VDEKHDIPMDSWLVTTNQLADLLGVAARTIFKFRDQGMPIVKRGRYHAPTCVRWLIDSRTKTEATDLQEQRQMLYKAQTDRAELENAKLRGELLEVPAAQTMFFSLGTTVRTSFEAIVPRIARQFSREQLETISNEINSALETVADEIKADAHSRDSSGDHPTAT